MLTNSYSRVPTTGPTEMPTDTTTDVPTITHFETTTTDPEDSFNVTDPDFTPHIILQANIRIS
jgi:hypothetical protein